MTRPTLAAKTLAQQILEHWEDADVQNHGEPDGLGVLRALRVDEPVAAELFEVLLPIADTDRRISSLELKDEGALLIHFTTTRHADTRDPFPLKQVLAVQNAPQADVNGPSVDEQGPEASTDAEPPKKGAAAKKAAAAPKPTEGDD